MAHTRAESDRWLALLEEVSVMLISIDLLRLDWTSPEMLGEPLNIRELTKRILKELDE